MILPVIAYGTPVLKYKAKEISSDYPALDQLISDMYETMYDASGVGLAAPQIGKSIRLFVIDTSPFDNDDFEKESGFEVTSLKKTFINPVMIDEFGDNSSFFFKNPPIKDQAPFCGSKSLLIKRIFRPSRSNPKITLSTATSTLSSEL